MLSVLVIGMPMGHAAQEFIVHANGDSINGDIEGFKRGKLKFKIRGGSPGAPHSPMNFHRPFVMPVSVERSAS